jgi:hypothetical protein
LTKDDLSPLAGQCGSFVPNLKLAIAPMKQQASSPYTNIHLPLAIRKPPAEALLTSDENSLFDGESA